MARVLKGSHSFICTPTRSSAIRMSHSCLCLPGATDYKFTVHDREIAALVTKSSSSPRVSEKNSYHHSGTFVNHHLINMHHRQFLNIEGGALGLFCIIAQGTGFQKVADSFIFANRGTAIVIGLLPCTSLFSHFVYILAGLPREIPGVLRHPHPHADSDWGCFRGCAISSSLGAPL